MALTARQQRLERQIRRVEKRMEEIEENWDDMDQDVAEMQWHACGDEVSRLSHLKRRATKAHLGSSSP